MAMMGLAIGQCETAKAGKNIPILTAKQTRLEINIPRPTARIFAYLPGRKLHSCPHWSPSVSNLSKGRRQFEPNVKTF